MHINKPASDLERGDRVVTEFGVSTVRKAQRGFIKFKGFHADDTGVTSVMVDWEDGEWTQLPATQQMRVETN